jgi:hypothetical protein
MSDRSRDGALSGLSKRGGYSGSKPGSAMRPPVHVPASTAGQTSSSTKAKKS